LEIWKKNSEENRALLDGKTEELRKISSENNEREKKILQLQHENSGKLTKMEQLEKEKGVIQESLKQISTESNERKKKITQLQTDLEKSNNLKRKSPPIKRLSNKILRKNKKPHKSSERFCRKIIRGKKNYPITT